MVKALIFDLGGTLVKTDEAILEAIRLALQENGIQFTNREAVINVFGHSLFKDLKTAVEISYSGKDAEDVEQKIQSCYVSFQRFFPLQVLPCFKIIPQVLEGLEALRQQGKKLAVLTAFERKEADFFLEWMKLKPYFDVVISTEDTLQHRPNPQSLLAAVSHLGFSKEECLYVGDTMLDIQFARNAGIKIACVKTGAQDNTLLEKEGPDYLVDDLKELVFVILKFGGLETKGHSQYTLRFLPSSPQYERLQKVITELSAQYSSPVFEPHVTLYGRIIGEEAEIIGRAEQLVQRLSPLIINFIGFRQREEFFRSLFMEAERTPELERAYRAAQALFEPFLHQLYQDREFIPHLSLLYGNLSPTQKENIIATLDRTLLEPSTADKLFLCRLEQEPVGMVKIKCWNL